MKLFLAGALLPGLTWAGLWLTPDEQGQRLMNRGDYQAAAEHFQDPMRQGVAWYRAKEFEKAEQAFARVPTAEAEFNRGNCLVFQGKYQAAIERYDRALELRPDWEDAEVNREIARIRAERVEQKGGDLGDQQEGADKIVFDKQDGPDKGQETQTEGSQPLSDAEMQALWLRRVQTKPAEFLKNKFAYQLSRDEEAGP